MDDRTSLEQMLRAHHVKRGAIQMTIIDGEYGVTISHQQGHQTHPMGRWHQDPVSALRAALLEDDRVCRDLARRYDAAPKVGDGEQIDIEDVLAADDDFGELLG